MSFGRTPRYHTTICDHAKATLVLTTHSSTRFGLEAYDLGILINYSYSSQDPKYVLYQLKERPDPLESLQKCFSNDFSEWYVPILNFTIYSQNIQKFHI
jgi:hypothetical protein